MDILAVMCIGVLAGNCFFPERLRKVNEKMQTVCTVLLIFCMGVTLGGRENFLQELGTLGGTGFLFFLIPSLFSLLLVYGLTRKFMAASAADEKADTKEPAELAERENME